ncbi:MarR family winged helix-turn-helix transcriptional regulator [Schinkia azotoformans]|uniref:MarR family winged helix-turn-helix transcriptional regulator n=1 Tax=Schinkia azotoformans TaxID=1454 RepID=UPI002DB90758|nr:MarR family transcriptional regulator [Schinkia azotoformans]MEC1741785.1 MarR family transcriptional regulator [Schinkia azotoformans]MEC1746052.1 MarR family transcriptional regulator [Schinkia azotoformans]MEC1757618.1 MarR family transcriptional regulator [Schinkia azotoformans]MEC1766991.1 MarR family transcriptional regulator [Schinkia azotoformans]MEC1771991.1 MarR family transcriptional regulator [Schinkia azotoformans]
MKIHTNSIRKQIGNINKSYYDLITHEIGDTNLTVPQVLVCRCIKDEPQMVSSISETVKLANSTVSSIIDRLEKNGYVTRIRDSKDRRIVWVAGTEKLAQLRKKMPVLEESFFEILFEDLDEESVEQIYRSLELLANHMMKKVAECKKE